MTWLDLFLRSNMGEASFFLSFFFHRFLFKFVDKNGIPLFVQSTLSELQFVLECTSVVG